MALNFNLASGQDRSSLLQNVLAGRQRVHEAQARNLISQALKNPAQAQAIIPELAKLSPQLATQLQTNTQNVHRDRVVQFGRLAKAMLDQSQSVNQNGGAGVGGMDQLYQQLYPKFVELSKQLGRDPSKIPTHYDPAMLAPFKAAVIKAQAASPKDALNDNLTAYQKNTLFNLALARGGKPLAATAGRYGVGAAGRPSGSPFGVKSFEGPQGQPITAVTNKNTGEVKPIAEGQGTYASSLSSGLGSAQAQINTQPTLNRIATTGAQNKAAALASQGRRASQPKARSATRQLIGSISPMLGIINQIANNPHLSEVVGAGAVNPLAWTPGTEQATLASEIKRLTDVAGLTAIQQIRKSNETGGAGGQITEGERKLFANKLANLSRAQTPESFKRNLQQLKKAAQRIINISKQGYKDTYGVPVSKPIGGLPVMGQKRRRNQKPKSSGSSLDDQIRSLLNGQQ